MSSNTILESAGLNAGPLSETVLNHLTSGSPYTAAGTFDVETICAGAQILAARLTAVLTLAKPLASGTGPAADLARTISELITPDTGRPARLVADAIGLKAPILASRPVFNFPELRSVTHAVIDEERETFVLSSYLVDLGTESVFAVHAGESVSEAAARVRDTLEQLSTNSRHRSK